MDMLGDEIVLLKSGAVAYPITFVFAPCSNDTTNDGSIPYGTTIASATVTVLDSAGTDISSSVVNNSGVVDGLKYTILFDYPALAAKGMCIVNMYLTLSSGAVLPKRWNELKIE